MGEKRSVVDDKEGDHWARGADADVECAIRAELNRSIWSWRIAAAAEMREN